MTRKERYAAAGIGKLLTPGASNAKTAKAGEGLEAVILHLAPDTLADGRRSVCPWSTAGCRAACLNTSGRSQLRGELTLANLARYGIHRARRNRTLLFLNNREEFLDLLRIELRALVKRARKTGATPVARLNGTSDIPWEAFGILEAFPEVQFYDYTKSRMRAFSFAAGKLPANYHLTYSRTETDPDARIADLLHAGVNVAVVFSGEELPAEYYGAPVADGLASDWRFRDPRGVVVGLLAKARAKVDTTGFVVQL